MKLASMTALFASFTIARMVSVPSTCEGEYKPGRDVVIYTVPYTYSAVMSIIGSYKNLTWSGNPPSTVSLNGTDNKVGTTRIYNLGGMKGPKLIETITKYEKPKNGPYDEVHTTALLEIPIPNGPALKAYIPYDGTTVTEVCGGKASRFNFTANFCANFPSVGKKILHMAHMADAAEVGVLLGGKNFTSCSKLDSKPGSTMPSSAVARPPISMLTIGTTVAFGVVGATIL